MSTPDHLIFNASIQKTFLERHDKFHSKYCEGLALYGYSNYGKDIENIPMNVNYSLVDDVTGRLLVGAIVSLDADLRVDLILGKNKNNMNMLFYWFKDYPYMVQIVRNFPSKENVYIQVYQLAENLSKSKIKSFWKDFK